MDFIEHKKQAARFAKQFLDLTPSNFVLRYNQKYSKELLKEIAIHIKFLQEIYKKCDIWRKSENLITLDSINLEQSSSQTTAEYKAKIVGGDLGLDLTGGLGIDTYFFAQRFTSFTHNEPNPALSSIVQHNFNSLGVNNVVFTQRTAENFNIDKDFDFIYLDPSRRDTAKNKVFLIAECSPNLVEIQDNLLSKSKTVMVKYSPMLDIKAALAVLNGVKLILILAEKNEVKELVFVMSHESINTEPELLCTNLQSGQTEFSFTFSEEKNTISEYSPPLSYLYEPNAPILKAGAFDTIGVRYSLKKIAPNSHLYTSSELSNSFPGRVFEILNVTNFDAASLNNVVPQKKANISTRNFPLKPEEIKKKLKWQDGGELYVFFTEDLKKKKIAIICKKI